jgi:hypothetical protein
MDVARIEAPQQAKLDTGTYRCRVMLDPWVELPTPKPIGTVISQLAPPPSPDIPEIPDVPEAPHDMGLPEPYETQP